MVHAVYSLSEQERSETVLLVDTSNVHNPLNRQVTHQNTMNKTATTQLTSIRNLENFQMMVIFFQEYITHGDHLALPIIFHHFPHPDD